MKICLSWLNEYLPGPLDAEVLADALTRAGLPVESIETVAGETVLDVEVTSNRPDCLSYLGIAHELAAMLDRPYRDVEAKEAAFTITQALPVTVTIAAPQLCPHYTARVIENVAIRPSPTWLSHRLEAMGLRPINNVVDVTNYVLFEMGQPLHAFDFTAMHGKKIIVRLAKEGETLVTLDGRERKLEPHMLTIADADRPLALAGVMGGRDSEVTDATHGILLESARFQPLSIRKTSRQLAMRSDSSYRFERGIDPTLPLRASRRAVELILQTAGGTVVGDLVEAGASGYSPKTLHLRIGTLIRVLGIQFPFPEIMSALSRLRLQPKQESNRMDRITVTVPSDRLDLNEEIDLVEEVARMIGYDKIPERKTIRIRLTPRDPKEAALSEVRSVLAAAGYYESLTMSFVSDSLAGDFAPLEPKWNGKLLRADPSVRKADATLRPSILPGLLESVRRNHSNGTPLAKLFEIGSTFWETPDGKSQEERTVALVGSPDLREVRGAVEALLHRLDPTSSVRVIPAEHRAFAAGAAGRIEWNGKPIGVLGTIESAVADKLSLRQPPAAAELRLAGLLAGAVAVPTQSPLPRFPAVRRDLSLIVAEIVRYAQIDSLARALNLAHLEDVEYVTTYRGKPLERRTKSVTITLIFRSPTETLTSEQVESAVAVLSQSAQSQLGATLRI
jgi:phenylalanyl-tRNA synthetase beta chain